MLIDIIAGTEPDFIKIAPVIEAIHNMQHTDFGIQYRLIYTGQQKSIKTSFYELLGLPSPHLNLEAGAATDAEQTATIMVRYEKVLLSGKPNMVLLTGDSNGTPACAITAKRNRLPLFHLDGGLRSNEANAPDEINRIMTDAVCDYFFTSSRIANDNLRVRGVTDERIFFVGNTLADTILRYRFLFQPPPLWDKLALEVHKYFLITLHRAENIKTDNLKQLLIAVIRSSQGLPLIFPVKAEVRKSIEDMGIRAPNLFFTEVLDYVHYSYLVQNAKAVITDSGSLQDEASIMQVPCITIGSFTDRHEAMLNGTSELIASPAEIPGMFEKLFAAKWKRSSTPYMWDGKAGERIAAVIKQFYKAK